MDALYLGIGIGFFVIAIALIDRAFARVKP